MKSFHDIQYQTLLQLVLNEGIVKNDRTGTGTISIFGNQMRFKLDNGSIPLLTTKKMHLKSIIYELLWYISGSTNNNDLLNNNVTIWNEWAREDGSLGPIYGKQLRCWEVDGKQYDQLMDIINLLKKDPDSRRMVVSYWNVGDLPKMALQPCHMLWQLYTTEEDGRRTLSMKLTQRSCDLFLGVPYNIVQYSILLHMLAHICNMDVGEFIWSGGDIHLYSNHIEQAELQILRSPYPSPTLRFARQIDSIDDFRFDDFIIEGYESHPPIKADVAV